MNQTITGKMGDDLNVLELSMKERSKIFQRYFKSLVKSLHVRKEGAWIEISGSKDINGTFTEEELTVLKNQGYNPGSNFLCFNFEDQTSFIKHWIKFGKVKI
jgi:hypothetical protein